MKERKPHGLLVGGLLATLLLFGTNTAVFADAGAGAAVPAAQAPSGRTQVAVARRSYPDVAPATVEQTSPGHYRLDWSGLEGGVTITVASAADAPAAARRLLARGLEGESASVVVDREARPYFHIEDRHGRGWWAAERLLPLEGGRNFRDLGGYLTADRFLQAKKPESDDEAQARTPMQQAMVRLPAVVIQAMLGAEPDYLAATFDAIEKRNGSVENYLREVLGVTDADLATLRQSLLD